MPGRQQVYARIEECAAEIDRLHRRIHETFKLRGDSEEAHEQWLLACAEFHAKGEQLCRDGGFHADLYPQIRAGEPEAVEFALCFLELRPYFFRSGYMWKDILRKCKNAPLVGEQAERRDLLIAKYAEWRERRRQSSIRGAKRKEKFVPLVLQLHHVFPVTLSDEKFDGMSTVGDLYRTLCDALKVEPQDSPEKLCGRAHPPNDSRRKGDMAAKAKEKLAWRGVTWTAGEIWVTLAATIADVYLVDQSAISSSMNLPA